LKVAIRKGDDLQDAYDMAADVLCLMLYNFKENRATIPLASDPNDIKVQDGCFVSLVGADTIEYRRFYDNKVVKKTLTLPQWLNTMAERENINFSQVLQDALKKRLKV
jgi:antitoxin HicB